MPEPEGIKIPEDVQKRGGEAVVDWLLDGGHLDLEALSGKLGDRMRTATAIDQAPPPEATPQGLDEAGERKVNTLFESLGAGYTGYALKLLRDGGIDPGHLPEGSAPLWESPEAALAELLSHLTPEVLEVIQRDCKEPAIVVEPIRADGSVYVKDPSVTNYDRRVVGTTPFAVSEWSAAYLDRANADNNVGAVDGNKIVGWSIGIADKAQVTRVLATDGDVTRKPLQDRVRDFHAEGGHGAKGFSSVMDHPVLYGLMTNGSRQGESPRPIDDVQTSDGVWTMGTNLYGEKAKVYDPGKDGYPRVAGGVWFRSSDDASLHEYDAGDPSNVARVRLAVMFKKV